MHIESLVSLDECLGTPAVCLWSGGNADGCNELLQSVADLTISQASTVVLGALIAIESLAAGGAAVALARTNDPFKLRCGHCNARLWSSGGGQRGRANQS